MLPETKPPRRRVRVAQAALVLCAISLTSCASLREHGEALIDRALRSVEERVPVLVDGALDKVETRLEEQIDKLPEIVGSASKAIAGRIAGPEEEGGLAAAIYGAISAGVIGLLGWLRNRKSDQRKSETEKELAELRGTVAALTTKGGAV